MAKIIGLKEMQNALAEVTTLLRKLAPVNEFIATPNPGGEYSLSFERVNAQDPKKTDKVKTKIVCEDKSTINLLALAYKSNIIKRIKEICETYNIELSEEEKELMKENLDILSDENSELIDETSGRLQ